MAKISAFIARKKTSKAGKVYYAAPYGLVDLVGFLNAEGDILFHYSEREDRQVAPGKSRITPAARPEPARPKIIPRAPSNPPSNWDEPLPPADLWDRSDADPNSSMPEF